MKRLLVLILLLAPTVWAVAPASTITYSGMTEEFPPYNYMEGPHVVGYSTEVMELAFKKAGLKTTFTIWPWLRSFNQAKDFPDCYVYSTSRTPEREKLFKWVGPLAKDSVYLMALRDSTIKETPDFKNLKKYKIAGQLGDQPVNFLQQHGFEVMIAADEETRMKLFKDKQLDLDIMTTESQPIYEKRWRIKYRKIAFLYETEYWAAFNLATPDEVIAKLNRAVHEARAQGAVERIAMKYRGQ